jgi:transposase-like protein
MFKEDLNEGGRYLLEEFFHQIMAHDLYEHIKARRHERTPARSGYSYECIRIGTAIGSVIF